MSLLDKASLIVTPNSYKESKLYSVVPNTTLGDMDVVRATTATRVNSAGLIEVVPRNLLTYSQDFSNAAWVKSNSPTMTYNSAIAPNGTMTASGIKSNDATNYKSINQTISSISPNSTFTYSIYVKKETSETFFGGISVYLSGGTAKVFYGIVNAVNGTVTIASSSITPTIQVISEGNYWRIIATATDTGSNTSILAEYYATFSQNGTSLSTGIGSVRTIWGFQLEQGSTATEYFPTTTRLNIPRIDYTNGSCPSLLVEPQRTNLFLRSEEFDNIYWVKNSVTVTANSTISPSGIQNAERLQFTGAGFLLAASQTSGTVYTLSCWAKRNGTGTQSVGFFKDGSGSVDSAWALTSEWKRFTYTYTASNASFVGLAGVSGADVFVWGAQFEVGAYATSYIPTVASSVTRNADLISKTGVSSLIGQTEGTVFFDGKLNDSLATTKMIFQLTDGTDNNRIQLSSFSTTLFMYIIKNNVAQLNISYALPNFTDNKKIAFVYSNNNFKLFVNGALVSTNTTLSIPNTSVLNIGSYSIFGQNNFLNINSKQLYKIALTDAECIALTTL